MWKNFLQFDRMLIKFLHIGLTFVLKPHSIILTELGRFPSPDFSTSRLKTELQQLFVKGKMLSAFGLENPVKEGEELQLKLKPKCCFKNKLCGK